MVKAFVATEDARFFEHKGVDLRGIARAVVSLAQTGERTQGGSTITMQVARNFFLSSKRTFQRKFAELLLSIHIEHSFTKEEILELYLNKIFFGHRAYGVSAAAALYYGKQLEALNLAEIAMLAGLPKFPSANNQISNPTRARERRNYILWRMRELDYITPAEFRTASEVVDQARLHRKGVDLFDMISEETQSLVRYPSDLIDEEWEILQPIINELEPYTTGRPRTTDLRDILNAIFYLNKAGCPWRYLPQDFPSYKLVNYYYNKWTDNLTLEKVNTVLRQYWRQKKA